VNGVNSTLLVICPCGYPVHMHMLAIFADNAVKMNIIILIMLCCVFQWRADTGWTMCQNSYWSIKGNLITNHNDISDLYFVVISGCNNDFES